MQALGSVQHVAGNSLRTHRVACKTIRRIAVVGCSPSLVMCILEELKNYVLYAENAPSFLIE